jgi:hypothetical protein
MRQQRFLGIALALGLASGALAPRSAAAADYGSEGFGLGLFLGQPSGLTLAGNFGGGHMVQGYVAFELVYRDSFILMADYIWHPNIIVSNATLDLSWHFGGGVVIGTWLHDYYYDCARWDRNHCVEWEHGTRVMFGLRMPFGLDLFFHPVPLELYFEIAPGIEFFPVLPDLIIFGGIGLRYWF